MNRDSRKPDAPAPWQFLAKRTVKRRHVDGEGIALRWFLVNWMNDAAQASAKRVLGDRGIALAQVSELMFDEEVLEGDRLIITALGAPVVERKGSISVDVTIEKRGRGAEDLSPCASVKLSFHPSSSRSRSESVSSFALPRVGRRLLA